MRGSTSLDDNAFADMLTTKARAHANPHSHHHLKHLGTQCGTKLSVITLTLILYSPPSDPPPSFSPRTLCLHPQLSARHRHLLLWLLDRCWDILKQEHVNRMSVQALAVVLVPNLFSAIFKVSLS